MDMSSRPTFQKLEATRSIARQVQDLTLQDLRLAGVPNPTALADPTNEKLVDRQIQKLKYNPLAYSGFMSGSQLLAFMKCGHWKKEDEAPFVDDEHPIWKSHFRDRPIEAGVFALVASEDLSLVNQHYLLGELLRSSFHTPFTGLRRTVNIILHAQDPLHGMIHELGFRRVGKPGEAVGVPGATQEMFRRESAGI